MRKLFIGSLVAAALAVSPAAAFDTGNPAADAVIGLFVEPGDDNVSVGSVSQDGDTLTINDVSVTFGDGQTTGSIGFSSATVTGLAQDGDTFTADQIELRGTRATVDDKSDPAMPFVLNYSSDTETGQDLRFTRGALSFEPPSAEAYARAFSSWRTESARFAVQNVVTIEAPVATMEQSVDESDGTLSSSIAMNGATVTLSPSVPVPPDVSEVLPQPMTMDISMGGSVNIDGGKVAADDFTVSIEGAGALSLSFALSGLPKEIFSTNPADGPAAEQQMAAMMMSTSIESASIKLTDEGVANRALAVVARHQNSTPDALRTTLIQSAGAMMMLAIQNQTLVQSVVDGVTSVLNGGAATVSATPASPVPVAQLMALGMQGPGPVLDALNVQVAPQ